jgi:hypothetical protein
MPYFGSTLFFVALLLGSLASLMGAVYLVFALARSRVRVAAEVLEQRPFASVLIALPIALSMILVIAVLSNLGPFAQGMAFLWAALTGAAIAFGLSVSSLRVGLGLDVEQARPATESLGRGALAILLSSLLPFLGWFIVLPLAVLGGLGASALSALASRRAAPTLSPTNRWELG